MIDQIIKEAKPKMNLALQKLANDLVKVRTGRANAAILDGIFVSYYGIKSPIKEIASITVPEPAVIAIKPWDRNALADIELAIRNSDLGLSPINDGVLIRLVLPPMTEDRRKELAGQVKKSGEEAKVTLRNIRAEAWGRVQEAEKKKAATEDDRYRAEEELNRLINDMNKQVDETVVDKEKELMKL